MLIYRFVQVAEISHTALIILSSCATLYHNTYQLPHAHICCKIAMTPTLP